MSTSTSTSPLGDCVVCGTKTATRCSSCSAHGTDWMYFCSTEHQKLVWSIHKQFCGPRSNPFQWPLLSKKEVEQLYSDCAAQYTPVGKVPRSLLDLFIPSSPTVSLEERKGQFR
ncbi:hypothetical protein JCM5353_003634, partial [Sporobolomyces roseus]